jgi:RHS repeat-associated protein
MPFGEEIYSAQRTTGLGYTADNVKQKFTGYIRDDETDLDFAEARYYNKQHGRFTAVDPLMASASTGNPQTWNRYIYVGNNPLNITDPTGLSWYYNKNVGEGGTYKWYGDNDTVGEGYTSVVGTTGNDSRGVGSFVYQNGRDGGWVSLNSSSNSWKSFDTQADALKNFDGQCANCQALANSIADNAETKGKVVGGLVVGAVVVGTGAGVVMAATGTAAGAAVTTLGLTETATGVGTTVAAAAAANPDKAAQLIQGGTNVVYQGVDGATGLVRYVGITQRDAAVRFGEHLNSGTARSFLDYSVVRGNLSRIDARILEQNMINQHGLPNLLNRINSIAPRYWQQHNIQPPR